MSIPGSSANAPHDGGASDGREVVIEGTGVSPGIAIGSAHRYTLASEPPQRVTIERHEVERELGLFDEAIEHAQDEIERVRAVAKDKLGPEGDAIFDAQTMMLQDDELRRPVRDRIREEHESAAHALTSVLEEHRRRLEESEDEYLRERATDLDELEGRLLRALQRGQAVATVDPDSIVIADRLTTGDVVRFSRSGMLGCVMARGGRTSHVSILARALNVPAIVGADGILETVDDDARVILDGRRGRLIVHPTPATLAEFQRRRTEQPSFSGIDLSEEREPVRTADGHRVCVRANVEFAEALDRWGEYGAEGIGLMRTEMFFFDGEGGVVPEEKQVDVYRKAALATGDDGATIRLLDLGGDKLLPLVDEDNPFLGWRGIRVLLDRADELLRPQIRALLRANTEGSLRVLVPMVTHLDEVYRVHSIIREECTRLRSDGIDFDEDLPVGVMVETPAVALQAASFAEVSDFMSVGTNDLTQYVLAIDRGNDLVATRYDDLHPAVLQLIRRAVRAGRTTDTPIELCGELAADRKAVPILVGLGLDGLSVAPPYLRSIKQTIRAVNRDDASELAEAACDAPDAETVRRWARQWIAENVDSDGRDPS